MKEQPNPASETTPIWVRRPVPDEINAAGNGLMQDVLGIRFVEVGPDFLTAEMPVEDRTKQIMGLLHGGASAALAETVASFAGWFCVDESKATVGIELNINHVRAMREGLVTATARALHLGRSTQVWEIRILDAQSRLVAISRLTLAVVDRRM